MRQSELCQKGGRKVCLVTDSGDSFGFFDSAANPYKRNLVAPDVIFANAFMVHTMIGQQNE